MESYNFNGNDYVLHIVSERNYDNYELFFKNMNVCERSVISKNLEQMSYESLELEGYYGFFISNAELTVIHAFVIIDINCESIKIPKDVAIDISTCVGIVLYCSSKKNNVRGLASDLFKKVIEEYIPMYKPNCENVLLTPATSDTSRLSQIYSKFGFRTLREGSPTMILNLSASSGGRRNRNRRKSNRRKKYKNKSKNKRTRKYYSRR